MHDAPAILKLLNCQIAQFPMRFYVSLRSSHRARRTQRRCHSSQPGALAGHDPAPSAEAGGIAGVEPNVHRIPEIFWRDAETGQADTAPVGPQLSSADDGLGDSCA